MSTSVDGDASDEAAASEPTDADTAMAEPGEGAAGSDVAGAGAAADPPAYEWSAFRDDDGRVYYYNARTEESSWEPPADGRFNPPEEPEGVAEAGAEAEAATTASDEPPEDGPTEEPEAAPAAAWVVYQDDEGRDYYYNSATGETQWEAPDGYTVPAHELETDATGNDGATDDQPMDIDQTPEAGLEMASSEKETNKDQQKENEEATEPEVDPAVKRLQAAKDALALPDSVLEPDVMEAVTEVVTSEGGNPQSAIMALIDSFHGQTAICGLLGRWLADIRHPASNEAEGNISQGSSDEVRRIAEDIICKIAQERFTKETGDSILNLPKSEVAFLEEMMDSPRWRRLLIKLSASHKDSAMLVYCLRSISKRGHHREIAKQINQSDHFSVFNAMLSSELAVIGQCAVSAGSDPKSAVGFEELMNDLLTACTSTSFTYLYSVELLRRLALKANTLEPDVLQRFSRAIRKWVAISQNLEGSMMDPVTASPDTGMTPLLRKRRLETALTFSSLQQNRRKKRFIGNNNALEDMKNIESALLSFLRRHASGIKVDDAVLNALLTPGASSITGHVLIKHPLAIQALLCYMYKPGSNRLVLASVKNKCARLLALATSAAEKNAAKEANNEAFEFNEEAALSSNILRGSQLCEQVETMISFSVIPPTDDSVLPSPGQELASLARDCAPVALGVMIWARDFTLGKEFAASASFPTLSVSILSLVRMICLRHPFARQEGIEIAFQFLSHSNSEVSYKKISAIKEQSVRLLLLFISKGEVARVFGGLTRRFGQQSGSGLDASLIRYVVAGLLSIVASPVSLIFASSFAKMMMCPSCIDAIRSTYFGDENRLALMALLKSFEELETADGKKLGSDDRQMMSKLLSTYRME